MFTFGQRQSWQADEAVQQILVFPNAEVHGNFEKSFAARVESEGVENASDSNLGAIYKLRSVKNSDGTYAAIIRCGITGLQLWESIRSFHTPEHALEESIITLRNSITDSIAHKAKVIN